MSVEQDFLVFAGEAGANVLTQAEYVALAALLTGFQSGVAPSAQLNKVWRQGSIMASVLGQLISDITGQPVIDDGTIATIEENLATVFRGLGKLGIDTGAANALVVTQAPAPSALYAGMDLTVIPANNGTGAATLDVNGLGALPIQYPSGSAIGSGAILAGVPVKFTLNSAKSAWIIGNNPTVPTATAPDQPVALGQFPFSVGAGAPLSTGYIKFPNGIILQWGYIDTNGSSSGQTVTYPIAFPNAMFISVASDQGNNMNTGALVNLSNSQGTAYGGTTAGTYTPTFLGWIAVGY